MRILLLILVVVSLVSSQGTYLTWQADTIVTSPQMGSGYFDATVSYDWTRSAFKVDFKNAGGYSEYYKFNADRGYNPKVLTGQFTYQYLYKISSTCPCETSSLQVAMPAWFYDAPNQAPAATPTLKYWPVGTAGDTTLSLTTPYTRYTANSNFKSKNEITGVEKSYSVSPAFWLDTTNKKPAGFSLFDTSNQLRTFTITKITEMTSTALNLVEPSLSCPCGKLVDIVLSLDRSGSISPAQWTLEYDFVKNLAASFQYGALGANLGIGNWNAQHWRTLDITSGTSKANVDSAVSQMTCCPGTTAPTCCCCGTPIGGGLKLGGLMLSEGRPKATKVLIVLTDGCQNHLWDAATDKAIKCACSTEKICAQNTTCTGDITAWFNWVRKTVPGVTILSVGVGDSTSICPEQLLLAAGGDTTNVYNPTSWTELNNIVKTISATACSANAVTCTGCCGLCNCGKCILAPGCKDTNKCLLGKFDNATQCCGTVPQVCPIPSCTTASCDPLKGCQTKPIVCKTSTDPCIEWACNSTTAVCLQRKAATAPATCNGPIPECVNNSDCARGSDPCTVYACALGKCVSSSLNCGKSDNCTTRYCQPNFGCKNATKTCNDQNVCTDDSCDPTVLFGCVFKTRAPCPKPKSQCFDSICDPRSGCIDIPVNCTQYGYVPSAVNCTIPACNMTCYNKYICIAPTPISQETFPQTVILASALGTAAIAGIVIGAAVLLAGLGTAAGVAIVGAAGAGGVALVAHNPTYVPSGAAGNNVLYKQND